MPLPGLDSFDITGREESILIAKPWTAVDTDEWNCHLDLQQIVESLDPQSRCEALLRQQMCRKFSIVPGQSFSSSRHVHGHSAFLKLSSAGSLNIIILTTEFCYEY